MADTFDEDLYTNDSESMGIYNDAKDPDTDAVQQEHSLMSSSYPIMDELIAWFTEQVEYFSHNDSIDVNDNMDDYAVARQLFVNKAITNKLSEKRDELLYKFGAYKESQQGSDNG